MQCTNPPSKPVLVKLFTTAFFKGVKEKKSFVMENRTGLEELIKALNDKKKWPDKECMILLLAKIPGQSCEIFNRDYQPPAPGAVKAEVKPVMMYNADGFWDGLNKVSDLTFELFRLICFSALQVNMFLIDRIATRRDIEN